MNKVEKVTKCYIQLKIANKPRPNPIINLNWWTLAFKAGPPWLEFLVIFDFFASWYRTSREAFFLKTS